MPSSDPDERAEQALEGLRRHFKGDSDGPARDPVPAAPRIPRYEIHEPLGEGAGSIVWRARDRELGRFVAVKVMKDPASADDRVRERFQREARIAAGITHANVVPVHDAGEAQGRPYLVMELVDGEPLTARFTREKLSPMDLASLLERAARGVAAAHDLGVVHRDLKPANILLTREGEPKVSDFGIARVDGSEAALTRTGTVLGTPLYMAPEQIRGRVENISSRTDVYALGAILYEGLTGRPPHAGGSITELYARIVTDDPASPRALNPAVPRDLELVCLKALEKDPVRRYSDAREFAEELHRFRAGEPVHAKPPGRWTRADKWIRKHRTAAVVAAALVLVAVVSAVSLSLLADSAGRLKDAQAKAAPAEQDQRLRERLAGARERLRAAEAVAIGGTAAAPESIVKKLEEARAGFVEVIAVGGAGAEVHRDLGRTLQLLGDDGGAEAAYRKAMTPDAKATPARLDLALLLWTRAIRFGCVAPKPERGTLQAKMQELYVQASREMNGDPMLLWKHREAGYGPLSSLLLHDEIARPYDRATDDGVIAAIKKASGTPTEGQLRWMRALHVPGGETRGELDLALNVRPNDPDILLFRSALRLYTRDVDGAREDADRAVALAPSMPEARVVRGRVLARLGRDAEALADFVAALKLAPGDWAPRDIVAKLAEKATER